MVNSYILNMALAYGNLYTPNILTSRYSYYANSRFDKGASVYFSFCRILQFCEAWKTRSICSIIINYFVSNDENCFNVIEYVFVSLIVSGNELS